MESRRRGLKCHTAHCLPAVRQTGRVVHRENKQTHGQMPKAAAATSRRKIDCATEWRVSGLYWASETRVGMRPWNSVIYVNENENENYPKRKNNDSVNEN